MASYAADISVIIPAYNREATIARAIDSVLMQKHVSAEVIVVDDGSRDRTLDQARRRVPSSGPIRLKIIALSTNTGAAQARNAALNEARGRYVAFLDSDDQFCHDTTLSDWITVAAEYSLDLTVAPFVDAVAGRPVRRRLSPPEPVTTASRFPALALLQSFWQLLYRRSYLEENNLRFLPELRMREDWPFLVPALLAANRIGFFARPVLIYNHDADKTITRALTPDALGLLTINIRAVTAALDRCINKDIAAFRAIKSAKYLGQLVCIWGDLLKTMIKSGETDAAHIVRNYLSALSHLTRPLPDYTKIEGIAAYPGAFFGWPETGLIRAVVETGSFEEVMHCITRLAPLRRIDADI